MKFCTMIPEGVLRCPLKFYNELENRFWENWCQINMGLSGDWYIFYNREPMRFYVFMKTGSTDRNKDQLSLIII